ncbi:MAG: extracellular solute-binding protein [Acetatifactor sp.]|nr:extracellular solute-binding protein [Acetatifactor sp.]
MKRTKRFLSAVLTASLMTGLLAGCGSTEATNDSASVDVKTEETATSDSAVDQEAIEEEAKSLGLPEMTTDDITLTYACWGLAEKGEIEARDKQLQAFMEAYPNITVEFVNIDQTAWDDGLTTLAATGSLPDVFWVYSVTNAVANEWALDVTDFYENDPEAVEIYGSMVDNARIGGKLYGMPTVMFPYLVFLNKTVFEKYNEPLPSYDWTIDEFKEIAERITHPDEFYFGTSNPNYTDYFPAQYNAGQSAYGWDGESYHFDQTWVDALNLKYNWIDSGVCEWAPAEDKLRFLGDEGAWPPGFGRSAMHFDWTWTIAYFEDAVSAQSGCEFLYYPQPQGPSGAQMAVVDYGVISASTEHPREAWELQKWTSWGKEACLNRYEGYKEAGLEVVSRMPVIDNPEVWDVVKGFTDKEDIQAVYDHLVEVVPSISSVAPGYNQFNDWMNENEIWAQLDNREIAPADIADELTQKANEFKDEWLANYAK